LLNEPTADGATLALIDCGLMASIEEADRDNMISAVIHLANKDYASLVDDFIELKILPADCNKATIIPLMDKALSPYVRGGGAKKYEEELRKLYGMDDRDSMKAQVGGFQAMTQDALTVLNDVPFSIPPYFAILGRAIVTLEGIALSGNPDYGIIMDTYPFIARKLLREGRPEIQKALQEVLYSGGDESSGFKLTRLLALLNNAAGSVATQEGAAFVDLDSIPENGLSLDESLRFVLSDQAESLRTLLEPEVDNAVDILSRQVFRRAMDEAIMTLTPRPPSLPFLGDVFPAGPKLEEVPLPLLLPRVDDQTGNLSRQPSVALLSLREFIDALAPKLTQDEEIFAIGLAEGAEEFLGRDISSLLKGEGVLSPRSMQVVLNGVRSGILGRQQAELVSSSAAKSVLEFVSRALPQQVQQPSSKDPDIYQTLEKLPPQERSRLDEILEELTQRVIQRALRRLDGIERIA
jgi:aarF domain-containing kinase